MENQINFFGDPEVPPHPRCDAPKESVKPIPWDGKCPHCGDKRKIFPTGGSITPMDPNLPTREVLICNYCYKTFQIYDKIERIPMLCLENI